MLAAVGIVFLLVACQGLVNGAEVAISQLAAGRPREGGGPGPHERDGLPALVATVQVLATGLGVAAGVVAGIFAVPPAAAALSGLWPGGGRLGDVFAAALTAMGVALASVTLGEMMPVSVALARPQPFASWLGPPLWRLSRLARPLTLLVAYSGERLGRSFSDSDLEAHQGTHPVVLRQLMEEAAAEGRIDPQAAEIAGRALSFAELTVSEVMVPRHRVDAVELATSAADLRRALIDNSHDCLPVFRGTLDEVVGVLVARQLLAQAWGGELRLTAEQLQPPLFVPEMMRAVDLLADLKTRQLHFAVVVDELGGTAGIVTLEDLLEELVGEIAHRGARHQPEGIRAQPDGSTLVGGMVPIRDINRALAIDLEEGDDWSTLGGLCVRLAGGIPVAGDILTAADGRRLEVLDATPRRVQLVRMVPPPATAASRARQA